jgi:hypothetical protein
MGHPICAGRGVSGRALRDAHLSDDETVAKMGTHNISNVAIQSAPVFCGKLPYFGGEAARDVVVFCLGDATHALTKGDGTGGGVVAGFLDAEGWLLQVFEPEACDFLGGFGHQAASLPVACEPEATIVVAFAHQADGADDLCFSVIFETEHPVPLVSAFDGGNCIVAVVRVYAVGREWPGDTGVELPDDLPLREEGLDFDGI